MVNKLDLNNELISLRKQFAKAKSRTINKLTRKIKSLEHGKTKDPKNTTKLDGKNKKLAEELKLLKNATKLDMVKKAYVFSHDPEKCLKLQKATPEQRAICRLLMNPFLKEAIVASKKRLDVIDGEGEEKEEEWKKDLFEMGKNKKRKLMKEKYEAKAAAEGKTEEKDDVVEDNKEEDEDTSGMTPLEKKIAGRIAKNKEKKAAKKLKASGVDDKSKAIDKSQKKDNVVEQKKKQLLKPKPSGPPKAKQDNSPPKKVNLFPMEKKEERKPTGKDFGQARDNKWNKDRPARPSGGFQRPGGDRGAPKFDKPEEKLHPSWEAKKNKTAAISEFKGKKITFDA